MSTIKSSSEHLTLNADGASKDIKFQANGVEKARIDSSGNVGIGVTPEDWKSVYTALQVKSSALVNEAGATGITDNCYKDSGGWKYIDTGEASLFEQLDGIYTFYTAASGTADSAITWTTGFEVLADGKARAKNGLLFGTDTAAANALDDYEEGTWTATLASGATTTPTATGHYTKIGREVHIYLNVNFGSIAVNGTALQISGLPFTPNHPTTGSMGYTARVQMQSTAHHFTAVDSGVTTVEYRYMSANVGGSSALLTQSSGTFTPAFQLAMTYLVP